MNQNICNAIKNGKVIKFFYDGGEREVEPFTYGRNSKGNDVLSAFQIGGYSSSGSAHGWRLYIESNMTNVIITKKTIGGIRPGYNAKDSRMVEIYCTI